MSDDPLADLPVFHWQHMADYVPGRLVLVKATRREQPYLASQKDGHWFEMVDGEIYELADFVPEEWCEPPGGTAAWA